ncbi:MAG: GntR family transcriptional regulator [Pseudomonadota bacterium]
MNTDSTPTLVPHATPSFLPLYEQIKSLITKSLALGEWKPGESIPSEMELATRYKVSQGTVRKAIDALAAEFIVVRRQGKGTFVATHAAPSQQYRFLRVRGDRDGGDNVVHPTTTFIGLDKIKADAQTAVTLAIRVGVLVSVVKRVLVFAGRPVIYDQIYLANAEFPGLNMATLEASHGSVYSFLESAYGTRMIRAEEKIKAVAADRTSAKYLKVAIGTPLLSVDRVAYTYGDKPVEWRRGLCLTEGYSYFNELA